jgi:hypothetical protein
VLVTFECVDPLSLVYSLTSPVSLSSEGAGQHVDGTCVDNAGNQASFTVIGIDIDLTDPDVSVTGVSNGAHYTLGSVPAAGCETSDGLSGVQTEAVLSTSGGPVGTVTATCSGATDNADNSGSASVSYSVEYAWNGFFKPVDNLPILNVAKAGSAIPVKFSLGGNQGLNIFDATYPKSQVITCDSTAPVDGIEETVTAGGSSLQYDAGANQYIYVWKTDKAWAGSCRQLVVKLVDGTFHRANFKLTK